MDRLASVNREQLIERMRADFEQTMRQLADAVNAAPDGHLIDGSEEKARDLLNEFRRVGSTGNDTVDHPSPDQTCGPG